MIKLHYFLNISQQLWKAGETSHLKLNTHAGQAWIGIRTPLGYYDQPHQDPPQYPPYSHQTPTHCQYPTYSNTSCSPSYYRRKERRKAAKAADITTTTLWTLQLNKLIIQHHTIMHQLEKWIIIIKKE